MYPWCSLWENTKHTSSLISLLSNSPLTPFTNIYTTDTCVWMTKRHYWKGQYNEDTSILFWVVENVSVLLVLKCLISAISRLQTVKTDPVLFVFVIICTIIYTPHTPVVYYIGGQSDAAQQTVSFSYDVTAPMMQFDLSAVILERKLLHPQGQCSLAGVTNFCSTT